MEPTYLVCTNEYKQSYFRRILKLCTCHAALIILTLLVFIPLNLFSGSPIRWKILTETTGLSLYQTSQTPWSARIEVVKPLVKRPREILVSLQKLYNFDLTADLLNEVKSLEKLIQFFEFIIMTPFWFKALQTINYVSVSLLTENISLDDEMKLIKTLIEDLTRLRPSCHKFIF